jgi:hypothetical protein
MSRSRPINYTQRNRKDTQNCNHDDRLYTPVVIIYDPDDDAGFQKGAIFDDKQEVEAMLKSGSFSPGTKVVDRSGKMKWVCGSINQRIVVRK